MEVVVSVDVVVVVVSSQLSHDRTKCASTQEVTAFLRPPYWMQSKNIRVRRCLHACAYMHECLFEPGARLKAHGVMCPAARCSNLRQTQCRSN